MIYQLGFQMNTHIVSGHRLQENQGPVNRYTVMKNNYRMKPSSDKILKVQSGGNNAKWQIVRKYFSIQVSVMFGTITENEVMIENDEWVYSPILIWFSKKNLLELNISQFLWWLKCHIEQQGGKLEIRIINTYSKVLIMAILTRMEATNMTTES